MTVVNSQTRIGKYQFCLLSVYIVIISIGAKFSSAVRAFAITFEDFVGRLFVSRRCVSDGPSTDFS